MKGKNTLLLLSLLFVFNIFCLHLTGFAEPQPSAEFPIILFSELNYNNGSDNANQFYTCLKEGEFHVWGRTITDQKREFLYRSLVVLPGRKLTFKAGFSSGNRFTSFIYNVTNISNIHLWMFDNQDVGGSSGIWYTQWEHWQMDFALKVEPCPNCTSPDCGGKTCYFGTCGIDGECQCLSGYSGSNCSTRPGDSAKYPSIQYPLILFPDTYFSGTPKQVEPDTFEEFAKNSQSQLVYSYQSMRILFRRKITFSRVDHNVQYEIPIGRDIEDIPSFMIMNEEVGDELWINYSPAIDLSFAVKVDDNPACTNCSEVGGSCFTGICVCLPGYSGENCDSLV